MYSCKKFLSVAKMAKTVYEREMCLASHQCGPGSISALYRVEFVVGSRLSPRVFLGFSGFPPSTKPNIFKSNSTRTEDPHESQLKLMWFLSVTFFPVTSPVSKTFSSLPLVLGAHFAICRYMFTVGFQYNFRQITNSFSAGSR